MAAVVGREVDEKVKFEAGATVCVTVAGAAVEAGAEAVGEETFASELKEKLVFKEGAGSVGLIVVLVAAGGVEEAGGIAKLKDGAGATVAVV